MIQGERKHGVFDFSREKRIRRLKGSDRRHLLRAFHLLRIEVRDADVADLSFGFELRQSADGFFDRAGRSGLGSPFQAGQ